MPPIESYLPYVLTGCIFYGFGLKWCYEYAKCWSPPIRNDEDSRKELSFMEKCDRLLSSHPIEGGLKLLATAVGLVGTLVGNLPEVGAVSPKVVHATIYLFFAFSGLVDVLNFYFPRNISDGLTKLALGQSFFVEGLLFVWANTGGVLTVNVILAGIVWTTCFTVALELIWPEAKLLRAFTTLLHGGWIAHMIRMYQFEIVFTERIVVAFSWHIAIASAVTLCIVTLTRSCKPCFASDEPPEVPLYDYCQEPEQRL